ncbi:hypothetical protein D1O30_18095 [Methylocystis hirsuta]|uniref:Uncharacterized protein n=1 Tax=Methylocystis hirsuta TaxID=369798 RepID=A0A3M9XSJ2_9HYPH|nr:hypothetical protein D1O30_18095 [Methylocystis hirsuta]
MVNQQLARKLACVCAQRLAAGLFMRERPAYGASAPPCLRHATLGRATLGQLPQPGTLQGSIALIRIGVPSVQIEREVEGRISA